MRSQENKTTLKISNSIEMDSNRSELNGMLYTGYIDSIATRPKKLKHQ